MSDKQRFFYFKDEIDQIQYRFELYAFGINNQQMLHIKRDVLSQGPNSWSAWSREVQSDGSIYWGRDIEVISQETRHYIERIVKMKAFI